MLKTLERCKEQERFFVNEMGYTTIFASEDAGNYIMSKVDRVHGDIQLLEINKSQENPIHILIGREELDKINKMFE